MAWPKWALTVGIQLLAHKEVFWKEVFSLRKFLLGCPWSYWSTSLCSLLKQGLSRRLALRWAQYSDCLWVVRGLWVHSESPEALTLSHELGWALTSMLFWVSRVTEHLTFWFLAPAFCYWNACKCSLVYGLQLTVNSHPISWTECETGWWGRWVLPGNILPDNIQEKEGKDEEECSDQLKKSFKPMHVGGGKGARN